jgi:hypothetical protein
MFVYFYFISIKASIRNDLLPKISHVLVAQLETISNEFTTVSQF